MNRHDFIRSLAGIPFLGFLKPEAGIESGMDAPPVDDPLMEAHAPTITQQLVEWNGGKAEETTIDFRDFYQPAKLARMDAENGIYWESTDGGKTWQQPEGYSFNHLT